MAAAASEEKQLISEEWAVEVQNFLEDSKNGGTVGRTSMRVSRALINAKAEAYIPQMLSLGPYHHRSLQEEPMGPYHTSLNHLSQMDIYKLNSTVDATKEKPVVDFFTKIEEKSAEFEQFYDWKINERDKFGWMMTVDALFLYQFLKNGLHLLPREATIRHTSRDYEGESHLLGCMHKYLSFLQIHKTEDRNPSFYERFMTTIDDMVAFVFALFFRHPAKRGDEDFLDKYNAKELAKAGIKFKPGSVEIMFDKHSDTLFLPKIVISHTYTEVMLRNLLALEFNDTSRAKHATQYVELMDCLIDTPEDVALLRKSHVIKRHSMMITDEYVAKMWDGMAKPMFFAGFLEHAQEVKAVIRETLIKNYYKSKLRNWWAEFHWEHLSTPWKVVALLIAILVVGLTAAQTYCAFAPCQKK